jgi:hypothetical protein
MIVSGARVRQVSPRAGAAWPQRRVDAEARERSADEDRPATETAKEPTPPDSGRLLDRKV